MTLRLQIILFLAGAIAFGFIFKLIEKGVLQLKYSILWLVVGGLLIIMAIFPQVLDTTSEVLGVLTPVNALFLIGYIFLLAIIFSLTMAISKYSDKVRELAQQIALLKKEIEK